MYKVHNKCDNKCKHTSEGWCMLLEVDVSDIIDADGWDRKNFIFSFFVERISKNDFLRRLKSSTIKLKVFALPSIKEALKEQND